MSPSVTFDETQLAIGTKVEMEHTDSPHEARHIAMDHLAEDPDYYTKLCAWHEDEACSMVENSSNFKKLATAKTVDRIQKYINEFFYSKDYRVDPETLEIINATRTVPVGLFVTRYRGGYLFGRRDSKENISPHLPADPGGGRLPPLRRVNAMEFDKITSTAGALRAGDRIGRADRAAVRYSTLSDSGAAYLVYVEGENAPRRYGRQEPLIVFRPKKPNPLTGPAVGPAGRGHQHEYESNSSSGTLTDRQIRNIAKREGVDEDKLVSLVRQWEAVGAFMGKESTQNLAWELSRGIESKPNPTTGMTAKGRRMYEHVKVAGGAQAPSAVVYGAASRGARGLVTKKFAKEHGYPRPNPFMVPEYAKGTAWEIEDDRGGGYLVLSDVHPTDGYKAGDIIDVDDELSARDEKTFRFLDDYTDSGIAARAEVVEGWFAHLTAHGYMDQTEWAGPFKTQKEAEQYIEDTYEVDPETGEELE